MNTAICIASGPSLTQADVDYCRGKGKVYVVNDCHRLAPWADVLYACDLAWWEHHNGVPEFQGEKWTIDMEAKDKFGINRVHPLFNELWSETPEQIALGRVEGKGGNSGFQAMNLAAVQGASRIILLGYDMQLGPDKQRHWFGDHPDALNRDSRYDIWAKNFKIIAPRIHVEVINCSRETALDCFPRRNLTDCI